MITRIVKLEIKEGQGENFVNIFKKNKVQILKFEGCIDVELFNDTMDENIYFTISKWNEEQDLENYRNSEFFKNLWPDAKNLFKSKANAWSLTQK